ncbi:hypothetical protein CRYUN_Cryun25bG0036400 [Craigia yunnanensis]
MSHHKFEHPRHGSLGFCPKEMSLPPQRKRDMAVLIDHISKEMNELNLIRCQKIPKRPDVDCHDLPAEKFVWMEAHQLTILTRVLTLKLIIGWFAWRVNDGVKMSRLSFLISTIGIELRLGTVMDHHSRAIWRLFFLAVMLVDWLQFCTVTDLELSFPLQLK